MTDQLIKDAAKAILDEAGLSDDERSEEIWALAYRDASAAFSVFSKHPLLATVDLNVTTVIDTDKIDWSRNIEDPITGEVKLDPESQKGSEASIHEEVDKPSETQIVAFKSEYFRDIANRTLNDRIRLGLRAVLCTEDL